MHKMIRTESASETVISILKAIEEMNHLKDVDTILDKILLEARQLSNADAGSIFLLENEGLKFSFVHNDTLFQENESNAALYVNYSVPVNHDSIVGHAAITGKTLAIDNVYAINEDQPYSFNPSFDRKSGYETISMLTIPLKSFQDRLVGVMQLINARNENNISVPFSEKSRIFVPLFAHNASVAIERGVMNRELILRMMKMAELRDPTETGPHVQRVGSYAAEIYYRWALRHKISKDDIKYNRDLIRLAAMLHDIGKVGISDTILKKPAKLTRQEYETMKWHTIYGARLLVNKTSDMDRMSADIALHHHEKWDGPGYPGKIDVETATAVTGQPINGKNIPLSARITALADVFDALTSRRAYKEPWSDDKTLKLIEENAGKQFDPELVEIFFEIFDVIKAIRAKFQE